MDGELLPNELIVPIRDDNLLEDMEAFNVILSVQSSNPRVFVGEPNIQTIWIEDNDCEFKITHWKLRISESLEMHVSSMCVCVC